MDDVHKPKVYQTFVLRCWAESPENFEKPRWRFSLEPVASGRRTGFANLWELISFLLGETGEDEINLQEE